MRYGRNTEIEDGMGFAGLVPSKEEQAVDRMFDAQRRRIRELEAALRHYTHCRHVCIDCFCTKEARAAINGNGNAAK